MRLRLKPSMSVSSTPAIRSSATSSAEPTIAGLRLPNPIRPTIRRNVHGSALIVVRVSYAVRRIFPLYKREEPQFRCFVDLSRAHKASCCRRPRLLHLPPPGVRGPRWGENWRLRRQTSSPPKPRRQTFSPPKRRVSAPDNTRLSPDKKDFTAPQGLRTSLPRSSSAVTCCCSESRRS